MINPHYLERGHRRTARSGTDFLALAASPIVWRDYLPPMRRRRQGQRRGLAIRALATLVFWMIAGSGHSQVFGPSPQRDIEQGAEAAKLVAQQIGLCSLPTTEAYVRDVGERLVAVVNDPRWKFSFQIVDQAEPNAFAVPGGHLYISRGMLALINREDELAGVMGHEIAHVTQRHSARQQRHGILPGLLSLPGKVVGGVVSEHLGALINAPIDTVGGAWLSRYSRGQESEADRIGIRTASEAGYDPGALADILKRLEQDVASQNGPERRFSIFDSHPLTASRLKDIQLRAPILKPAEKQRVAGDQATLFAKLDGLWWGQNPEAGVFHHDQFLQPVIGFTMTFPAGWKHQNTPQCVISMHPRQEAMLLLGIAGPASDPEVTGGKFVEGMRTRAGVEPISARKSSLGQFPVFVVIYLDRTGRGTFYLYFAWVAMGGKTYQLVGLAPELHRETLRNAALTLRPMTEAERGAVTGKRLRMVTARQGERLENLSARTGNVWSQAYTALVNGLDAEATLAAGQPVKIARLEIIGP
ncbi:MAG TPA: M48 family metalloprotease [Verrucomicrobiae bacterium]|nr:M48 family metalloprotease [Verrucomicrobiae bacterium]